MMKKTLIILLGLALTAWNVYLNFEISEKENIYLDIKASNDYLQDVVVNNFSDLKILTSYEISSKSNFKIIYRYNSLTCYDCVSKGMGLLEETLKEKLSNNLLVVSDPSAGEILFGYQYAHVKNFTEIDKLNYPYVIFIKTNSRHMFLLVLNPRNMTTNRILLRRIYSKPGD